MAGLSLVFTVTEKYKRAPHGTVGQGAVVKNWPVGNPHRVLWRYDCHFEG